MCVRMSMLRSFTKSQCAWFSTVGKEQGVGGVLPQGRLPTTPHTHAPPGLTLHNAPGVQSSPDPLSLGLYHCVAADNRKGRTLLGMGRCKGTHPVSMGSGFVVGEGCGHSVLGQPL